MHVRNTTRIPGNRLYSSPRDFLLDEITCLYSTVPRDLLGSCSRGDARYAFITSTEVDIGASIKVAGFDPTQCIPRECFLFPLIK